MKTLLRTIINTGRGRNTAGRDRVGVWGRVFEWLCHFHCKPCIGQVKGVILTWSCLLKMKNRQKLLNNPLRFCFALNKWSHNYDKKIIYLWVSNFRVTSYGLKRKPQGWQERNILLQLGLSISGGPRESLRLLFNLLFDQNVKNSCIAIFENGTLQACVGSKIEWKRLQSAYNIMLRRPSKRYPEDVSVCLTRHFVIW